MNKNLAASKMQIKLKAPNKLGEIEEIIYRDIESEVDFVGKKIKGCRAYCFYKDKFVIVYADSKGYWTPPGGGVEEGESVRDAVAREVKEETNMKVIEQKFFGLLEAIGKERNDFYTTSMCIVEPLDEFISDPDGEITKIKMIDLDEYKKYSDKNLGPIVDRQIERAKEVKSRI
ncbi:MAG: NUDIX hydrolase [Candidatus Paceibacterota bacterium]